MKIENPNLQSESTKKPNDSPSTEFGITQKQGEIAYWEGLKNNPLANRQICDEMLERTIHDLERIQTSLLNSNSHINSL